MSENPDNEQIPAQGEPVVSPLSDEMAPPRDFTAERDAEVIPVARKILSALAGRPDLKLGKSALTSEEAAANYYADIYQQDIVPILLESNLKLKDVIYAFQLMLQPITLLSDITSNSLAMNRDIAEARKWGIDDLDDLRIVDLDTFLKETATPPAPANVDKGEVAA